jgi:DNA-binding NtrC family response regulator
MVAAGDFREDLYYRLNVVPVWLPPLRARPGDVMLLARRFAADIAAEHGRPIELTPEALALLAREPWPGNVRQLRNFIERLVVLSEQRSLGAAEVGQELGRLRSQEAGEPTGAPRPLEKQRRHAEQKALEDALAQSRGNRSQAARILGISRRTLYKKLRQEPA